MAHAVRRGDRARDLAELVQFLGYSARTAERGQGLHAAALNPQERHCGFVAEAVADDPLVGVDAGGEGTRQAWQGAQAPHAALPSPQERHLPAAGGLALADDGPDLADAPCQTIRAAQR